MPWTELNGSRKTKIEFYAFIILETVNRVLNVNYWFSIQSTEFALFSFSYSVFCANHYNLLKISDDSDGVNPK